jgi:hypothetical protein
MVERQLKGLCYNCDEKYFPGHKCKEQKLFMAISEDVVDEEVEASPVAELPEPTLSLCHLIHQKLNRHFIECTHWLLCSPNPQANWLH